MDDEIRPGKQAGLKVISAGIRHRNGAEANDRPALRELARDYDVAVNAPSSGGRTDRTVVIERAVEFRCAWGAGTINGEVSSLGDRGGAGAVHRAARPGERTGDGQVDASAQ